MTNKKELMMIGMIFIGIVLISVGGVLGVEVPRGYNLLNYTNGFGIFEGMSATSLWDAGCNFNQIDPNTLEVTFNSDSDIDPQIYIGGIKIYITDAQHLDENHTFIENVYNETKTQDEVYTDYIPVDDYIRIWFPINLSNKNTIIILAESEGTANVEIYEKNGTELLGVFENIGPGKAKYETGVSLLRDTYDLKVVGDSVRFDYIVDPATVWIPPGYNLLNDSSDFGTFEAMSATSTYGGGFDITQVKDNNLGTVGIFGNGQPTNQNITINFTDSFYFDTVMIFTYGSNLDSTPNNTKIWVSEDGITYTNITGYQSLFSTKTRADDEYDLFILPLQKKRYLKIEFKDNWGYSNYMGMDEIRVYRNATNLANLTTTTVTATGTSTGNINNTRDLSYLVSSYWRTNDYGNVTWNFGSVKQIDSMIINSHLQGSYFFANYSILVSDDGSSWTEVRNGTVPNNVPAGEEFYFNFTQQNKQYLRLVVKDSYLDALIQEVRIFETSNKWICTSGTNDFTNTACWSSGKVPTAGEKVLFPSDADGSCNITNNTLPQDLESFTVESGYTGTIHFNPLFAVGDWTGNNDGTQLWNVSNDINVSGGTMKIWGDYLGSSGGTTANITEDGHGQEWRSVSGDVVVGVGAVLDGVGLGFGILKLFRVPKEGSLAG